MWSYNTLTLKRKVKYVMFHSQGRFTSLAPPRKCGMQKRRGWVVGYALGAVINGRKTDTENSVEWTFL